MAVSAYFIGVAAIIFSGIILKKTKAFAGDPAPFVMELPAYHVPSVGNVLRATCCLLYTSSKLFGRKIPIHCQKRLEKIIFGV